MNVLAIDAGFRNFSWVSLVAGNWRAPYQWGKADICPDNPKPSHQDLRIATVRWCDDNHGILDAAQHIVLERQIKPKFIIINTVVFARYPGKTVEYSPKTVGKFHGLPGDRSAKKKAAVDLVARNLELPRIYKKKDDLADAMLLAIYHMSLTSEVEGWRHVILADQKRRAGGGEAPRLRLRGKRTDDERTAGDVRPDSASGRPAAAKARTQIIILEDSSED